MEKIWESTDKQIPLRSKDYDEWYNAREEALAVFDGYVGEHDMLKLFASAARFYGMSSDAFNKRNNDDIVRYSESVIRSIEEEDVPDDIYRHSSAVQRMKIAAAYAVIYQKKAES